MAAFVFESDGELYMVLEGETARLPLSSDRSDRVTVPEDAPDWAGRLARDHGYTPHDAPSAESAPTPNVAAE